MNERGPRERDLVIAQGEQALMQDVSSGRVQVIVGPNKTSMEETDVAVRFEQDKGRFRQCMPSEAIGACPSATEGQYIILGNPVAEDVSRHPVVGKNDAVELAMGRTMNIPGPVTFPLFPRQFAAVVDGHILRSNQYLICRVVNAEEAMQNWSKAVCESAEEGEEAEISESVPDLVTGQLLIIKGTEVSFYIPPTGIEVLPDENTLQHVRDAVTLEQLEYCILLDEDGTKEFLRGPAVVFPKPTQVFSKDDSGLRKFRAVELSEHAGIYVQIIKSYEENGKKYNEGDELFITGKEQKIYFPRAEHSIIKYGKQAIHYAIAIPKGEARYVLNRHTGAVALVQGERMYLPDPRNEVICKRILDPSTVELLYPGNSEAMNHNVAGSGEVGMMAAAATKSVSRGMKSYDATADSLMDSFCSAYEPEQASDQIGAEEFARSTTFTKPRTVQLDTKYEGAVAVRVWTGYAVKLVGKTGQSRVIVGPKSVLLEYDEVPEVISLSSGKPKSNKNRRKDVYLRVSANVVSDVIQAETSDYVNVELPLSYRVNFVDDENKWFDVEDYVGFLTDHLRSLITSVVKSHGIEEFNNNYISILRDAILGERCEDGREGRLFDENNMKIYDVDFGKLHIGDHSIATMLHDSQRDTVSTALSLANQRQELEATRESEAIRAQIAAIRTKTSIEALDLKQQEDNKRTEVALTSIENADATKSKELTFELERQETIDNIAKSELARKKAEDDQEIAVKQAMTAIITEASTAQLKAFTPDLVAAIRGNNNAELALALAENLPKAAGPIGLLLEKGGIDALCNMFKNTPIAEAIGELETDAKSV